MPTELVGSFDRPNLVYRVLARSSLKAQILEVLERHRGQAGIIYCSSRKEVDALAQWLQDTGWRARPYHAGMATTSGTQPGCVPERRDRPDRRHGGVRDGHRPIGRALRDPRRRAAVARALPAGIRPRRPRRARGRVRADRVGRRLPEVADDAREERRAVRRAPRPAARHRALRGQRRLPPQAAGRLFRRDLHQGRLRRLRLLPRRARERSPTPVTLARKILSCVARVGQRFGAAHVTNVLRGTTASRCARAAITSCRCSA